MFVPAVIIATTLTTAGCVDRFQSKPEAGDVLDTRYGPARVELVEDGRTGPIYRLVFSRCHADMRRDDYDPVDDVGVPKPASLQRRWLWMCKA